MSRGSNPKEESYLFPLKSGGEALKFSIDVKGTLIKLRSEVGSFEKTDVILKKQLEEFEKLREETLFLKTPLEEARRI